MRTIFIVGIAGAAVASAIAVAVAVGMDRSSHIQTQKTALGGGLSEEGKSSFIQNFIPSCVQSTAARLPPNVTISNQAITAYCGCLAQDVAASVTTEELASMITGMVSDGSASASFSQKIEAGAARCTRALG